MINKTAVLLLGDRNDVQYASVSFLSAVAFVRRVSVVTMFVVLLVVKKPSLLARSMWLGSSIAPLFTTQCGSAPSKILHSNTTSTPSATNLDLGCLMTIWAAGRIHPSHHDIQKLKLNLPYDLVNNKIILIKTTLFIIDVFLQATTLYTTFVRN